MPVLLLLRLRLQLPSWRACGVDGVGAVCGGRGGGRSGGQGGRTGMGVRALLAVAVDGGVGCAGGVYSDRATSSGCKSRVTLIKKQLSGP